MDFKTFITKKRKELFQCSKIIDFIFFIWFCLFSLCERFALNVSVLSGSSTSQS